MKKTLTLSLIILIFAAVGNFARAGDALYEVNFERAKKGLRPYIKDKFLEFGAKACCEYRANRGIPGHCGDHNFLPSNLPYGRDIVVGGCAAWEPEMVYDVQTKKWRWGYKWGACCTYDNYTYAGAWEVVGKNGVRYTQLFVR